MRQAFGSAQAGCPGAHPPPSGSQLGTPLPQKLEEQDRRALSIKEQLQREHRFLKRRLEQLSAQSLERVRTDSTGSAVSTDDSEQGGPWGGLLAAAGWGRRLLEVWPLGRDEEARPGSPEGQGQWGALQGPGANPPLPFSTEVDVEGMEFGPGELDSVGSGSDVDDHYSLRGGGCSHGSFGPPCRRPGRPGLS